MASYNIQASGQLSLSPSETPASGPFNGQAISPATLAWRFAYRVAGQLADQVDGLYYATPTFVASTPQTIDLQALTDPLGNSITCVRVRFFAIKVGWTTDNVPLLVGGAGTNEWDGFLTSGAKVSVFPSSSLNDGGLILLAPQTTGIAVSGTSHLLKLDPQTAAGLVTICIGTCST